MCLQMSGPSGIEVSFQYQKKKKGLILQKKKLAWKIRISLWNEFPFLWNFHKEIP